MNKKEERQAKILSEITDSHIANLEYFTKGINNAEKNQEWFKAFLEHTDCDLTQFLKVTVDEFRIVFKFNSMKKLHYIRKMLRMIMPKYKDSLDGIIHEFGNAIVGYRSINAPLEIQYKFIMPMDKLPKCYTKGGKCGFKTRTINPDPIESIEFICQKEKK